MKRVMAVMSSSCLLAIQLLGHGFIADTAIDNFGNKPSKIKTVCHNVAMGKKQYVASWDSAKSLWDSAYVRAVGHAHINRAITIRFDDDKQHDLICSPSQSFYNLNTQCWVPAYQLKTGDPLLCQSEQSVCVLTLVYHKKRTTTYLLEVKDTHTFCVGHYRVLTHNTPLTYAVMVGVAGSFGAGAAAGGTTGSFFGPITAIGGFVLGGIIMVSASCLLNHGKIQRYNMMFNTHKIDSTFEPGMPEHNVSPLQIMQELSKGNAHVYPGLPPKDMGRQGCSSIEPPVLIATGCGQKKEHADISERPTGCFDMPIKLEDQGQGTKCVRAPLITLLVQDNTQKTTPVKTIEKIVQDCKPGRETRGKSEQFERDGGFEQAQKDFEQLGATNIIPIPKGKAGTLPDGRTANVRTDSSAKKPTLEVYNPGTGQSIKIRYH